MGSGSEHEEVIHIESNEEDAKVNLEERKNNDLGRNNEALMDSRLIFQRNFQKNDFIPIKLSSQFPNKIHYQIAKLKEFKNSNPNIRSSTPTKDLFKRDILNNRLKLQQKA